MVAEALFDGIAGAIVLFVFALQLELAERRLQRDVTTARLEISQARELTYQCLEDTRRSVLGLPSAANQGATVTSQIPVGKIGSVVTAPRKAESPAQHSPIRVLVVNDQTLFRQGLRQILKQMPDMEIVGEAAEAGEALEKVRSLKPDVAIVDVQLRGGSGIEFAAALNEQDLGTRTLILSARKGSDVVLQAIRAGASGYLLKDIAGSALADAVRAVYRGEMLLHHVARSDFATTLGSPNGGGVTESLTARERDVLRLIASGLRNKEIARQLKLAEATVKYHVTHLLEKLGVDSRTEALITAQKLGLLIGEDGA
jgi:DNA-binding NarL/FixJ family response regulator